MLLLQYFCTFRQKETTAIQFWKKPLDLRATKGPFPAAHLLHVECEKQQTTGNTASGGIGCSDIIISRSSGGGDCAGNRRGERQHRGGDGFGGIAAGDSEELSTQRNMLKPIGSFAWKLMNLGNLL